MEKIKKIYNVYSFKELKKEIQEKLIEEEKEQQYEIYLEHFLYNDLMDEASKILKKYYKNAKLENIYYSLGCCQGDGAMMEFSMYYYDAFIKVKQSGFYYHSKCFTIDGDYYLTEKRQEQLENKVLQLQEEFEKTAWDYVNNYDVNTSDVIEYLSSFKYLKDGTIFN